MPELPRNPRGEVRLQPDAVYSWDRAEPWTLGEDVRVVGNGARIIDERVDRPTMVLVGEGNRLEDFILIGSPPGPHLTPLSSGLGKVFDGTARPRLLASASHHDVSQARIVIVGVETALKGLTVRSATGVVFLARPSGLSARGNSVTDCRFEDYRFAVLASAQERIAFSRVRGRAKVSTTFPPGHLIYFNESRLGTEYLRSREIEIRDCRDDTDDLGGLDHCTFKFKGVDALRLTDCVTHNPCGALDAWDSSGTILRLSMDSDGEGQPNPVFGAFRIGSDMPRYGVPTDTLLLENCSFDVGRTTAPVYRVETPNVRFKDVMVRGGADAVVWEGCSDAGVRRAEEIFGLASRLPYPNASQGS
ncbi:MAG: hypothetical protein KIT11_03670 [Fimbriimonadaceae bacterium]|nr:hypothetical protein [Fimbriimonadaceae bacterium]QYK57004.1 MAG: hypothetical protein KF733_05855 [Fimbriimonadaceae bacterium]